MKIKKDTSAFRDFVLDQLSPLPDVVYNRMFGAFGVYQTGTFFAIIHQNTVFFKTNEDTRQAYINYGMTPFQPKEKVKLKNYYQVPVDILEDSDLLCEWALTAVEVGRSSVK